jgi:hypothetical protein
LILTNDISTGQIINGQATSVNYPGGVSGIIIDNVSTSAQASSVYLQHAGRGQRGNLRGLPLCS